MMIALPTTEGWCVTWYTGEVRPRTRRTKDGKRKVVGEYRVANDFYTTSREAAEAKAKELEAQGFEVAGVNKCFF